MHTIFLNGLKYKLLTLSIKKKPEDPRNMESNPKATACANKDATESDPKATPSTSKDTTEADSNAIPGTSKVIIVAESKDLQVTSKDLMEADPKAIPGSSIDAKEADAEATPGTSKYAMKTYKKPILGSNKNTIKGDHSSTIGTGLLHVSGGIKSSLHGTIYQVKLIMFFIVRALMNKFKFTIGTEVDAAEGFDDLVFEFENDKEKGVVFLQAKHRTDEEKTIKEIDLLNKDGHFSVPKYYYSFVNILKARYFKNILKDSKVTLVISTNIDIDNSIKDEFEEITTGEFANTGFLHPNKAPHAKFYKIIKDRTLYNNLVSLLENNEVPITLAENIAKTVVKSKSRKIDIGNLKRYRDWLLDIIFDHGINYVRNEKSYYVSFKEEFLFNTNKELQEFRQEFITHFNNERNNQSVTDDTIKSELLGVQFKVPKMFIKGITKDNKAKEFLDALIFAVKQPSEVKLSGIVEEEVGEYAVCEYADRKSMACKFQAYVLDWVKQEEGRFLKKADIEQQFAAWSQTDQSHKHINEIKSIGYFFYEADDVVVNISNFLKDENEQIICLYYTDQLLTEIKVCQALNIRDEFIFSAIDTLSEQVNTKTCPIKAFSTQHCNNVFIIINKKSEVKQKEEMLLRRLFDIVKKDIQGGGKFRGREAGKAKKRILMVIPVEHSTINERNNFFADLDSCINRIILKDNEVNFNNLSVDSKRKLFEKVVHKILGEDVSEILRSTFKDHSIQSLLNAVRYNLEYKGKSVDDHLVHLYNFLERYVKDDVRSDLISGDSKIFKSICKNYNEMTESCSRNINNEVLSSFITESTRADISNREKALSFFFNGLCLVFPVLDNLKKDK